MILTSEVSNKACELTILFLRRIAILFQCVDFFEFLNAMDGKTGNWSIIRYDQKPIMPNQLDVVPIVSFT